MQRALFIGRFQPLHKGHEWLFDQKLSKGIPILIAIRDIAPDEKNPLTSEQTIDLIKVLYKDNAQVSTVIIPDIESVNYGRGVGYQINEFTPPQEIGQISATQIRNAIAMKDDSWKAKVNPLIQDQIEKLLGNYYTL